MTNPISKSGIDRTAIHVGLKNEYSQVPEQISPSTNSRILIEDSSNQFNKKWCTLFDLDNTAIHRDIPNEFETIPEKETPSKDDYFLIEDQNDGGAKKKVKLVDSDPDSFHKSLGHEFQDPDVPHKVNPALNDRILIEDSEDSHLKKYVHSKRIDSDALHLSAEGQIQGLETKSTQVLGDWLILEDSEDSNKLKRTQVRAVDDDSFHKSRSGEFNAPIPEKTLPQVNDHFLIEDSTQNFIKSSMRFTNIIPGVLNLGHSNHELYTSWDYLENKYHFRRIKTENSEDYQKLHITSEAEYVNIQLNSAEIDISKIPQTEERRFVSAAEKTEWQAASAAATLATAWMYSGVPGVGPSVDLILLPMTNIPFIPEPTAFVNLLRDVTMPQVEGNSADIGEINADIDVINGDIEGIDDAITTLEDNAVQHLETEGAGTHVLSKDGSTLTQYRLAYSNNIVDESDVALTGVNEDGSVKINLNKKGITQVGVQIVNMDLGDKNITNLHAAGKYGVVDFGKGFAVSLDRIEDYWYSYKNVRAKADLDMGSSDDEEERFTIRYLKNQEWDATLRDKNIAVGLKDLDQYGAFKINFGGGIEDDPSANDDINMNEKKVYGFVARNSFVQDDVEDNVAVDLGTLQKLWYDWVNNQARQNLNMGKGGQVEGFEIKHLKAAGSFDQQAFDDNNAVSLQDLQASSFFDFINKEAQGDLNMAGKKITNVKEILFLNDNIGTYIRNIGHIDMGIVIEGTNVGGSINNVADISFSQTPEDGKITGVASIAFADVEGYLKEITNIKHIDFDGTGSMVMDGATINACGTLTMEEDADINFGANCKIVNCSKITMAGDINMANSKINNCGILTLKSGASIAHCHTLALDNGTGGNGFISGLSDPQYDYDASNKKYVDGKVDLLVQRIEALEAYHA